MDDKTLMKMSLAVSLIGIVMLFVVVQMAEPRRVEIKEITDNLLGQNIVVAGTVNDITNNDGNVFLTLNDSHAIKTVIFERTAKNIPNLTDIKKGNTVEVTGKITMYRNDLEITASGVKFLTD